MTPRIPQHRNKPGQSPVKPLNRAVQAAMLGMALTVPMGMALAAAPAWAQTDVETQFNIAAGPLGSALTRFASIAGVTVSFDPAHANGQQTAGLQGRYSVDAGLRQQWPAR